MILPSPHLAEFIHLAGKVGNAKSGIVDVLGLQEDLVVGMDVLQFLQQGNVCPLEERTPCGLRSQSPATGRSAGTVPGLRGSLKGATRLNDRGPFYRQQTDAQVAAACCGERGQRRE